MVAWSLLVRQKQWEMNMNLVLRHTYSFFLINFCLPNTNKVSVLAMWKMRTVSFYFQKAKSMVVEFQIILPEDLALFLPWMYLRQHVSKRGPLLSQQTHHTHIHVQTFETQHNNIVFEREKVNKNTDQCFLNYTRVNFWQQELYACT